MINDAGKMETHAVFYDAQNTVVNVHLSYSVITWGDLFWMSTCGKIIIYSRSTILMDNRVGRVCTSSVLFAAVRASVVCLKLLVKLWAARFYPLKKTVSRRNSQELFSNVVGCKVVFLSPRTYSGDEVCFVDVLISVVGHVVFQCNFTWLFVCLWCHGGLTN